ncbi:MAG: sugar ABC transporter ATP-binding protein [Geminicoccaceae bacterium]|nr:sugar ABC transporter ATP-binding protein [Geminicoccaceae bacterium]
MSRSEFTALPSTQPLLQVENLNKSFFGVQVLFDVGLTLYPGEVLGLVGENGSGKSTTMNILAGVHQFDKGRMFFDGQAYVPRNPRDASDAGLAFIHQELNLFGNLSIEENIFISEFPRISHYLPLIRRREIAERTREVLQMIDLDVAPGSPVASLSQGERQMVEIAKALAAGAKVIIFDEPTTSLTKRETMRLFEIIERLKSQGIATIYISHILSDIKSLCDNILILRDGAIVGGGPASDLPIDEIISLMVGREIEQLFPPRAPCVTAEPLLQVSGLSQPHVVHDIDFTLHKGEILGVSGLMGSGRSELARILFGLDPHQQGRILVDGREFSAGSPIEAMERGLAFLTEDRRAEGLMMDASITDNIALPSLRDYASKFARWLDRPDLGTRVAQTADRVHVNTKNYTEMLVKNLSGGNQQKVVLGKWLLRSPSVFILDEPTRGIDVGAKYEVYKIMNQMVLDGAGVLFISSEMEELIGMCDRIMVMNRGEISAIHDRASFNSEKILESALWGGLDVER